ncbi:MAG TPA: hypothetical protein VME46_21750, partial [Acidimicrobiales bacterium]|nr:hypothetical protein [Acidimicrobiales bacterium]
DQRFRLLTGGSRSAVARQRTLQATVDWSYDLLDTSEQEVLGLLSAFSGGFDLAAAEVVCGQVLSPEFEVADVLGSLVNRSLVVAERSSGSLRYRLLETIRQYASDKLVHSGGEVAVAQVRSAHAQYYLKLCELAAPALVGREQGAWLKRLDADWENLRTALGYLSTEGSAGDVLRLSAAVWRFFFSRGYLEPIEPLRAALARADEVGDELCGRGLFAAAVLLGLAGMHSLTDMRAANEFAGRAVEVARRSQDQRLLCESLALLCAGEAFEGDSERAMAHGSEALELARALGDARLRGMALSFLGLGAWAASTPDVCRQLLTEAVVEHRQVGDVLMLCLDLNNLGSLEWQTNGMRAARVFIEESTALLEEIGFSRLLPSNWGALGEALLLDGEVEQAVPLCRRSLLAARRCDPRNVVGAIESLAACFAVLGDHRRAAQLSGAHQSLEAALVATAPPLAYQTPPWALGIQDERRARLRQALGDEEFQRCLEKGRRMTLEAACDLALGWTTPD